ncbi:prolipoprotein diacylglyceryl transferase [Notoacmeibacter ruber]|uniref:Phosphatidylglycerol--prolipoprotein diacylglyceryl transferase n=1 Tax=Notoacmeibacter ruber TaxID=2670375 RepID=A0A3L7JCE1_9HYPH|nr:prolipoprotein diacylglyceryl transferase [Notoacmeibacter ruber]RLQ88326.1 prolipoprotein diacylglyceryl transferase [Notoacmeibacter ruber]
MVRAIIAPPIEGNAFVLDALRPLALIPYPDIDPIIFSLGPLSVRWYGLAYIASLLLGWVYVKRLVRTERLWPHGRGPMTIAQVDDFLLWAVVGVVLGGRLGYVLFYEPMRYLSDPAAILQIWSGGMSFHGGALGTILAMILYSRRHGIPTWSMLDTVAAAVPIGLFFGRIANFINAELWGAPTNLPWAMIFPTDPEGLPRHPSQLYEAALEGIVLFLILRWLTHSRLMLKRPKFVGGAFVAGYGICRILVEFVRVPDAQLGYLLGGWLTMGMVLSLPMVIAGTWAMVTAKRPEARPVPA